MRTPLFRRMKRWGIIVSSLLLSSFFVAACGSPQTTLEPAGPVAGQEATLFYIILGIATFLFVGVEGWLIFSIVRYRERPGMPQPRQIHGNNTVEIIWTVAPSIVLFIVLGFTITTMFQLTQPAGNTLVVKAVGHQWWWEFDYPNQNIVTADSLHVPTGMTVQVDLVSNNVIHSFWIPALSGKTDVIPNHNNRLWFRADKAGTFRGACAEYCGTQHAHMNFEVVADSTNDFNTWMIGQQKAAQTPTSGLAAQGAKLFTSAGCTACHGIVGVDLKSYSDPIANTKIGPNLTHFGSRNFIAGGVLATSNGQSWANDPACQIVNGKVAHPDTCGLYQWLKDPAAIKPGNDMAISLTQDQIDPLIAYLETLQ